MHTASNRDVRRFNRAGAGLMGGVGVRDPKFADRSFAPWLPGDNRESKCSNPYS